MPAEGLVPRFLFFGVVDSAEEEDDRLAERGAADVDGGFAAFSDLGTRFDFSELTDLLVARLLCPVLSSEAAFAACRAANALSMRGT